MERVGSQRSSYDELLGLVKGLSAQVEALTAMVSFATGDGNAELRVDNAGLRAENPAPKRKLGTDSSNSSAPPSRDSLAAKGKRRARRSQRVWSKAGKLGGQRDGMVRVWCRLPSRIGPRPRVGSSGLFGVWGGSCRWNRCDPVEEGPLPAGCKKITTSVCRGGSVWAFGRLGPPLETAPWRTGRTSTPRRSLRASAGNVPRPGRSSKD